MGPNRSTRTTRETGFEKWATSFGTRMNRGSETGLEDGTGMTRGSRNGTGKTCGSKAGSEDGTGMTRGSR
jgi:hypothetical protein